MTEAEAIVVALSGGPLPAPDLLRLVHSQALGTTTRAAVARAFFHLMDERVISWNTQNTTWLNALPQAPS